VRQYENAGGVTGLEQRNALARRLPTALSLLFFDSSQAIKRADS